MAPEGYMAGGAIVVAIVSAVGSWRTAVISRPKMSAEAGAATATGQVTISGDARAWAEKFEAQADKALTRAEKAEQRAREAEDRLDAIEDKLNQIVPYVGLLQAEIVTLGGHPTPPPPSLIPPLSRP